MSLQIVKDVLLWCMIINAVMLMLWFLIFAVGRGFIYRMHTRWFAMSEETFNAIHYGGLGLFKIIVLVFNIVPYVALLILR